MMLIRFYKNIWNKSISRKDRILFGLMFLLLSGFYFYSLIITQKEPVINHLVELFSFGGFILLIVFIRQIGNFIIKTWLSISGSVGQIIFLIIQFIVFYVILSPVYMIINLMKVKKKPMNSNWSSNPHRNMNYKNPG